LLTRAAVDNADAMVPPRQNAEIQVALGTVAMVGARLILAAEVFDGVHRGSSRWPTPCPTPVFAYTPSRLVLRTLVRTGQTPPNSCADRYLRIWSTPCRS